jgi:hypothetical protein
LQRQRESHALLFLSWAGEEGIYSHKLFEYVAARRPIIAIGYQDRYAEKVIRESQEGNYEQYSQVRMAKQFAEILNKIGRK